MKFSKFLMFILLGSVLLLSACGEDDTVDKVEASNNETIITDQKSDEEKFMIDFDITLTGKEVQYNMQNNLDKNFFLKGRVELCNYYNYGFLNESKFFCGKIVTEDNGNWHLYFDREVYDSVYKDLIDGSLPLMISAFIPSGAYKGNQGNMATVNASQLYNPYQK